MNRTAFVTGASRGIGAAIAREMARRGWSVIVAARTEAATQALATELEREFGHKSLALRLDVGNSASVSEAVAQAQEFAAQVAPIEALVNNAGIAISAPLLPKSDADEDLFELHLRVNFHGARRVAEALLPGMIERRKGSVVNVASSAGLAGYAYVAAYCASKHALLGWTRSAAIELESKNIGVHAICPHYVDSPMLAESVRRLVEKTGKSAEEARNFFAAQNPGGRLVTQEDVAIAVADLTEVEGTGQILELDGS